MLTRVGNVEIWRILESADPFILPQQLLSGLEPGDTDMIAREEPGLLCPRTGTVILPVQGFLVRTADHVILVDTCVGNHKSGPGFDGWKNQKGTRFMASLSAAGIGPEDVTHVMCTHLHVDHVGWNTRLDNGRWVPTFPNARYMLPAADQAHFCVEPTVTYNESVLPVIEAGQAEMVGPDHMLGDHVSLVPTPGHTPGHVSVLVRDGGAEAIITGDVIHVTVQCLRPDWNCAFDMDPAMAAQTRRSFLESASESGRTVLGTHFSLPSIGHVREDGSAFRWHFL